MRKFKTYISISFMLFILLATGCGGHGGNNGRGNAGNYKTTIALPQSAKTKFLSLADVAAQKSIFIGIPVNQTEGDQLPPQPGTNVFGQTVKGGANNDTNWTAFTIILFLDESSGKFEILTQKRAAGSKAPLVIETMGGHLLGGQSWRVGGAMEVAQESGIGLNNSNLIFLQGGNANIKLHPATGKLMGNVNFFSVITGKKPITKLSYESDQAYGHQWIDLQTLYDDVLDEQNNKVAKPWHHGRYYSFFRQHVIFFCKNVLGW